MSGKEFIFWFLLVSGVLGAASLLLGIVRLILESKR